MSSYTMREDNLEEALEKLCEKLIEKGAMVPGDKQQAVATVKNALDNTYPDGVPQDLFTDPAKQKTLIVGLISAPLMEKNPALRFDLTLFFKAELKPEEVKTLFKVFLTELNRLEPDPKKRRKNEEIEELVDALANKIDQDLQQKKEAGDSAILADSQAAVDVLELVFETLYGMTQFGNAVANTVQEGNSMGYIDTAPAFRAIGGIIHEGRGLHGDSSVNPYVTAAAETHLLALGGIGEAVLKELTASHLISTPPTLKPPGAVG